MVTSNLPEKALHTNFVELQVDSFFKEDGLRNGHEAALEFLSLLNRKFIDSDGTPHAPTILSVAAWLTGSRLYRSLQEKNVSSPKAVITSQDVNQEWEHLVYCLEQSIFHRTDIPVGRVVLAAMAAHHFWKPQLDLTDTQSEVHDAYNCVMKKHGFNTRESVYVAVILCSILIQQYSQSGMIDTDAATGVVAQGIFQSARQSILV